VTGQAEKVGQAAANADSAATNFAAENAALAAAINAAAAAVDTTAVDAAGRSQGQSQCSQCSHSPVSENAAVACG
jgi:hypothetical protein